jgi:hypothetical protein
MPVPGQEMVFFARQEWAARLTASAFGPLIATHRMTFQLSGHTLRGVQMNLIGREHALPDLNVRHRPP